MLLAVAILAIGFVLVVTFTSQWMVRFVSFETEVRLVEASGLLDVLLDERVGDRVEANPEEQAGPVPEPLARSDSARRLQVERYLQDLAGRLHAAQNQQRLPVTVHFVATEIVNAYATLGGNIVIHQGLLDQLSSEQGLAMVLAHEMAHIEHRDPMTSLGRGLGMSFALTLLTGFSEQAAAGQLVEATGGSLLLNFSREQERRADTAALGALMDLYGHSIGATEFFDYVAATSSDDQLAVPVFMQTHPGVDERLASIRAATRRNQSAGGTVVITPLPSFISTLGSTTRSD